MDAPFSSLTPAEQEALLDGPALAPPTGVRSNFTNPQNLNNGGFVMTSLFLTISTIFIFTRFYAKVFLMKRIRTEDCLIVVGYGIFVVHSYCLYRLVHNFGFRIHQWDVRLRNMSEYLYVFYISINLYCAHLMVTKSAILLEWVHLFVPDNHRCPFYWACHCLIWANVIFYSVTIIIANLSCVPLQRIWDITVDGKCNIPMPLQVMAAALNLVIDISILVLPQPVIWKLHMPKTKRLGVSVVFAIGILATVAACFRLANTTRRDTDDFTFISSELILWALVEMTCSFLVFCVPVIPGMWNGSVAQHPTTMRAWYNRFTLHAVPPQASPRTYIHGIPSRCQGCWKVTKFLPFYRGSKRQENSSQEWPLSQVQGIVRTREIISTVEDASSSMGADGRSGTCPWAEPV
ncbi:hypothetical protein F5Y11DRAFT_316800 [Daldinia sp. FL1419]|nr:hypothetical protein F5Y11DRAFT_316800 [Daldinia sp. FL1419]